MDSCSSECPSKKELERIYILLENELAPGGSEFFRDVDRCVRWVKGRLKSKHELILKYKKRINELEGH